MNEYTPETPEQTIARLTDEVARLQNVEAFLSAHVSKWHDTWQKAQQYLQASIDREEWEQSELAEPFWEELAEMFELDLKRTKEIEIRVTITYSGTVTVPYDCDAQSDLDIDGLSNEVTVNYGGEEIEDQWVTFEGQEIEEY